MSRPAIPIQAALVVSHVLVLVLPVLVLLGSDTLSRDLLRERQAELAKQGALVALLVDADVAPDSLAEIRRVTHAGVRVIDARGIIVATTGPRLGEDLSDREEVAAALRGEAAVAGRTEVPPAGSQPRSGRSLTWAYAAVPLRDGGALLLTRPVREVWDLVEDTAADLGPGAAVAAAATLALALWSGWRISRSLRALAGIAERVAEGVGPDLRALAGTRVSEVRMLARAFEAMTERLGARVRHNREFASHVSHEFKTPLTTLRGTVDLLAEDAEMPAVQRALFLENARTDLDRLHRLVVGLLELARVEEGGGAAIVDGDALLAELAARHPGVVVSGSVGRVPAQLELVIENLLVNAEQHGGPRVTLHGARRDGRVEVVVEDDGPGISAANLPRVFDRFFTAGRERRGTGLGLAIVRAVARAHGGDAEVESKPGRTCFRVWLRVT